MTTVIRFDGWNNPFQAVFFLEITPLHPSSLMKGTLNTQYHETFKKQKQLLSRKVT